MKGDSGGRGSERDEHHQPDLGYLKISKIFDPLTSGFPGDFSIVYNCGAGNVTVNLAAGGQRPLARSPPGRPAAPSPNRHLPTAPAGWTFGTPVIVPARRYREG